MAKKPSRWKMQTAAGITGIKRLTTFRKETLGRRAAERIKPQLSGSLEILEKNLGKGLQSQIVKEGISKLSSVLQALYKPAESSKIAARTASLMNLARKNNLNVHPFDVLCLAEDEIIDRKKCTLTDLRKRFLPKPPDFSGLDRILREARQIQNPPSTYEELKKEADKGWVDLGKLHKQHPELGAAKPQRETPLPLSQWEEFNRSKEKDRRWEKLGKLHKHPELGAAKPPHKRPFFEVMSDNLQTLRNPKISKKFAEQFEKNLISQMTAKGYTDLEARHFLRAAESSAALGNFDVKTVEELFKKSTKAITPEIRQFLVSSPIPLELTHEKAVENSIESLRRAANKRIAASLEGKSLGELTNSEKIALDTMEHVKRKGDITEEEYERIRNKYLNPSSEAQFEYLKPVEGIKGMFIDEKGNTVLRPEAKRASLAIEGYEVPGKYKSSTNVMRKKKIDRLVKEAREKNSTSSHIRQLERLGMKYNKNDPDKTYYQIKSRLLDNLKSNPETKVVFGAKESFEEYNLSGLVVINKCIKEDIEKLQKLKK